MEHLSVNPARLHPPQPGQRHVGVAWPRRRARPCLVCEAAGYDVVIVETVGVGQSETAVAGMTDMFVLMQLPNAGDDLQAIKKGVMELADLVVINKADSTPSLPPRAPRPDHQACACLPAWAAHTDIEHAHWQPAVMQLSALQGKASRTFMAPSALQCELQTASGRLLPGVKTGHGLDVGAHPGGPASKPFRQHPAVRERLPELACTMCNQGWLPRPPREACWLVCTAVAPRTLV
jgi:LAO/AO transport system kinase